MVTFLRLTEAEFIEWRRTAVREYAEDRVRAADDEEEGSVENSEKELLSLLPDGLKTSGHYFFSIVDERKGRAVGMIWYGEVPSRKDMLFVYDIGVAPIYRGQGYGTAALKLFEERARDMGKKKVALHVFGHNIRARKLYEQLGYRPTNVRMAKDL